MSKEEKNISLRNNTGQVIGRLLNSGRHDLRIKEARIRKLERLLQERIGLPSKRTDESQAKDSE